VIFLVNLSDDSFFGASTPWVFVFFLFFFFFSFLFCLVSSFDLTDLLF